MTRKKGGSGSTLSTAGKRVEKALTDLLDEIDADLKAGGKTHTVTDRMKVIDRLIKLEAIKKRVQDSEGSWFKQNGKEGVEE